MSQEEQEQQVVTSENITDEQVTELVNEASFEDETNKLDVVQEEESSNEERPEWLQEQFKSPEDQAKAYNVLRAKMDSGKSAEDQDNKDEKGGDPEESTEETEEAASNKSESVSNAFSEYQEKGELTEDTYKALEKEGFDKPLVDAYIAGQAALKANLESELVTAAGGNPDVLLDWGKQNLTDEQIEIHDKAMNGSVGEAKAAIELLKSRYDKAKGSRGEFFGKGSSKSTDPDSMIFHDQDDVVAAMNDPRYDTQASYRQKVDEAIARSFG
jgi:hypothetical protein